MAAFRVSILFLAILLHTSSHVAADEGPTLETTDNNLVFVVPAGKEARLRSGVVENVVATRSDIDTVQGNIQTQSDALSLLSDTLHLMSTSFSTLIQTLSATVSTQREDFTELEQQASAVSSTLQSNVQLVGSVSTQLQSRDTNQQIQDRVNLLSTNIETNLAPRLALKADVTRADQIEALLTRTWPPLEDFTTPATGWVNQNNAPFSTITTCGEFGPLLGGYGVLGTGTSISKTYQLPVHHGLTLELDFLFIDSWDTEVGRIYLDGTLVWQQRISSARSVSSHNHICGNPDRPWSEHVEHVILTLADHTATTVTLKIDSNLDSSATDESYGVSNIRFGPLSSVWPTTENFINGDTQGWSGATISTCGFQDILGGPNVLGNGGNLLKTYTHLPPHYGLRVQAQLYFFDTWEASEVVTIFVDGQPVWSGSKPSASVNMIGDRCGAATPDAVVDIDANILGHTSSRATVRFTTNVGATPATSSFGLGWLLLSQSVSAWPKVLDFETPDDANHWISPATITSCGAYGHIFGGYGQVGSGRILERIFTNLPKHSGIVISLTLLFLDQWSATDEVYIAIDYLLVATVKAPTTGRTHVCGDPAHEDVASDLSYKIMHHSAPTINLRIWSNIAGSGTLRSFALDNIVVEPLQPSWPPIDTFETGVDGWMSNGALSTSGCGVWGTILGGHNVLGAGRFIYKVYENLPPHTGINLQLDALFIDSWDSEDYLIYADNTLIWQFKETGNGPAGPICGSAASVNFHERKERLNLVIPHERSSLELRITSTLDSGAHDESFGVDNVLLLPAPELWPDVDDFEKGTNGWTSSPSTATTLCGAYGSIFGGYNVLGTGAFATKTYGPLPPHRGLRILMTYLFVDSWDSGENAIVRVDGVEVVNRPAPPAIDRAHQCGGSSSDGWRESHAFLDIQLPTHTAKFVTLYVTSNLNSQPNDESFAIDDVRILPLL